MNDSLGMISTAVACAATREEAFEDAGPVAHRWMEAMMELYTILADKAPDYAYLGNIRKLEEKLHDLDYLVEATPYISIGTPEFFVERARKLRSMGADEWILRVDGMGHEANLRTIELLGKEVCRRRRRSN